jgi:hypothetical protein
MQAKPWAPGDQFGRLTVTGPESRLGARNQRAVLCRCECGSEKVVALDKLRSGYTKSCGCLRAETARESALRAQQAKKGKRYDFKPVADLSNGGLHGRLKRDRGRASEHACTYADDSCKGPMHWANISHDYLGIEDFMPLCQSHHWRYDRLVRNLKRPWGL